jgi:hypothetical protein
MKRAQAETNGKLDKFRMKEGIWSSWEGIVALSGVGGMIS